MGDVLHLHDAHEQAQMLLPWHVNGTLEPGEAALVEAHLGECADCRADLAANLTLREQLAAMPVELEPLRPQLFDRLEAERHGALPFLRRRIPLGWALAGQGALAAAAVALFVVIAPSRPADEYELLASAPAAAPRGNVIVLFAPDTTEREVRAALAAADGRVVDGPTASGAWTVHVEGSARAAALGRLRQLPQVVLAEPIDASPADGGDSR
jgi:hypothetical protein